MFLSNKPTGPKHENRLRSLMSEGGEPYFWLGTVNFNDKYKLCFAVYCGSFDGVVFFCFHFTNT